MSARRAAPDRAAWAFWALLLAITALRVFALRYNVLNLHFDEAQYWAWSRAFDWGYFSKPPLIAWIIALTTGAVGSDAEWAVRLAAPIAHAIAAWALYGLGRSMYGPWPGFWSGIGWLLLPSVFLSSGIISTDALLLPLWSIALLASWRLIVTRGWFWAILLGLAIGFGALAKYAMLYFIPCALLAAWWMKPARKVVFDARGLVALLIGFAVLAPNLYWNAAPCFSADAGGRPCMATVSHTAANASISGFDIHFDELGQFLIDQAGVIGPVLIALLIGLLARAIVRARILKDEDRFLLSFVIPPLIVVSTVAIFSRANANWAAAAFPAAIVWVSGCLFAWRRGARWLALGAMVNLAIGVAMTVLAIDPDLGDRVGLANSVKRVRGWDETAQQIAARALVKPGEAPFTAVLVDDRGTYFELTYYWREQRRAGAPLPPVRMWLLHGHPLNSAEQTDPMRPEEGARVLVVHARPAYLPLVAGDFTGFRTVEHVVIPLGGGKTRNYEISVGELFAPVPRDAEFEDKIPD